MIDTQGPEGISQEYRKRLPGVAISGDEPDGVKGTPCHEHGSLCGWLAAIPRAAQGLPVELVFLRCFDKDARWIQGCDEWLFERVRQIQPDYVSRSWGAWDGDDQFWKAVAQAAFIKWVKVYAPMAEKMGICDFGAAGNNDNNDRDDDLAYPQAMMPNTNVVGAHDRRGIPCPWSGDGRGVTCCFWANRVWSPRADTGEWVLWSGTSAATPKAAGVAAARALSPSQFRAFAIEEAQRPAKAKELPHRKWGWGSLEWAWQQAMRDGPIDLRPPERTTMHQKIALFDYERQA